MLKTKILVLALGVAGSFGIGQQHANATTLHTNYSVKDVFTEKAMPSSNTSQGMATNDTFAYVARQRSGTNSPMYIERVHIDNGSVKDMGNRDIGHGNSITYRNGEIFVVRYGGGFRSGSAVNVYSTANNTLTYKRAIRQIKTDKGKVVSITSSAWDSKHNRMIYASGNNLYVAVSNNPYEATVHQVAGRMTDSARYAWAKGNQGATQAIAVDAQRNNIYYVKSLNLTPNGRTTIGRTSYVGSVNLNNAVNNKKMSAGSLDASLSYGSASSRFEVESVDVSRGRILFNTNNMLNRNNRSSHTDFIGWLK